MTARNSVRDILYRAGAEGAAPMAPRAYANPVQGMSVVLGLLEDGVLPRRVTLSFDDGAQVTLDVAPPEEPLYTWWGYRFAASFEKNYGWRLDHVLANEAALPAIKSFEVFKETRSWEKPSDHVPVIIKVS